jgi:hypothetical protein
MSGSEFIAQAYSSDPRESGLSLPDLSKMIVLSIDSEYGEGSQDSYFWSVYYEELYAAREDKDQKGSLVSIFTKMGNKNVVDYIEKMNVLSVGDGASSLSQNLRWRFQVLSCAGTKDERIALLNTYREEVKGLDIPLLLKIEK